MLHDNKELFEQAVLKTSEEFGIEAGIVEKDYFVTLFLKEISQKVPSIIFRGGTSLSKCHKLIKRFSEDIDLSIESEIKLTQGQRKALKSDVVSVIDQLGFKLANPDEVGSNKEYNRYVVDFPSLFKTNSLKPHLIVETAISIRSYPTLTMKASSLIYEYLDKNGFTDLIDEYELLPFDIKVQAAERTFVDKVYALCDYYLDGKMREHSRHLYDLYKLLDIVALEEGLKNLIESVREDRKSHKTCLSAQDGIDINILLDEIIRKDVYKEDYTSITEKLLFETVLYNEAILAVAKIRDSKLF